MKLLKPFLPSLYSEYLLTQPAFLTTQPLHTVDRQNQEQQEEKPEKDQDLIKLSDSTDQPVKPAVTRPNAPAADARGPGGEGKGQYERGLGETFGYPGDARKLRERSKIKLWREYFVTHGRNLTRKLGHSLHYAYRSKSDVPGCCLVVLRYPPFQRLLQVGLPSRLRGELWETLSGSICTSYRIPCYVVSASSLKY